jgi:hypothetical protein
VYGQVFNLIRASALLNYPNRPSIDRPINGDSVVAEAVVQPQDVANVLCCQPTLLSTTHKLDPRKRAILEAVNHVSGMNDEGAAVLNDIREWLEANDKPCPSESTLRSLLKDDLREDWFIRVNEGAGESGADLFYPRKESGLRPPKLQNLDVYAKRIDGEVPDAPFGTDLEAPFADCRDPIRDQPFGETVQQFREEFMGATETTSTDAASFMSGDDPSASEDKEDDTDGSQATLGGDTTTDEQTLEPDEEIENVLSGALLNRLREEVGTATPVAPVHTVSHYLNIVETDADDPTDGPIEGTLLDPDHDVYEHPQFADGTIVEPHDCLRALDDAFAELQAGNYVALDDDTRDVPTGFQLLRVATET